MPSRRLSSRREARVSSRWEAGWPPEDVWARGAIGGEEGGECGGMRLDGTGMLASATPGSFAFGGAGRLARAPRRLGLLLLVASTACNHEGNNGSSSSSSSSTGGGGGQSELIGTYECTSASQTQVCDGGTGSGTFDLTEV